MERWYYAYIGLHVTSELPIPEWTVFEQDKPFNDTDVFIRLGCVQSQESEGSLRPATTPYITADEHRFHIPEAGDYWIRNGSEIIVTPAPDASAREVRLFLLGSAWGTVCYQRGLLVLHSSVVQIGDYAVAFCGPTGSGKSTFAAWLVARGHRLIGDDLCHFEVANERVLVHPAAPRLKLWSDALTIMNWNRHELERDHFRADKYHKNLTYLEKQSCHSLHSLYLLDWGEPDVTRLTGLSALRGIVASATYRGELLEPMGRVAEHWQRCAELARCVPVFRCTRPRDWSTMDAVMEQWIIHRSILLSIVMPEGEKWGISFQHAAVP